MKISACYITKNEEENIKKSIESLQGQADEIIVVDTGSTDKTMAVARKLGARVYHFGWHDDFAAARNFALGKATGDWLVLLDADEYFTNGTGGNLRSTLAAMPQACQGVFISKRNYDVERQEDLGSYYSLRCARNIAGLYYYGRIHESLYLPGRQKLVIVKLEADILELIHTGYGREISREKVKRNLRIMQAEIADGRPIEELYSYLYDAYRILGDEEKAIHYAKLQVALGRQYVNYEGNCYRGLLVYYGRERNLEGRLQRLHYAGRAAEDYPELPDFHAEYGESLYQLYRYREALASWQTAMRLAVDYDGIEPSNMTAAAISVLKKRYEAAAILAKKAAGISLAACSIVRNEAGNIAAWLACARQFADEIIVVDTGSTDDTVDILRSHGIEPIEMAWQEDFSLAKNVAIEAAHSDWIVFNDADELFSEPQSVRGFVASVDNMNIDVIMMPRVDLDKDGKDMGRLNVARIFRRLPGLRYEGRVHEQLMRQGQSLAYSRLLVTDDRLLIRHTGYLPGIVMDKCRRNLRLLLAEQAQGEDASRFGYIADCYFGLGDYERALNYALRFIQSGYVMVGRGGSTHSIALICLEKLGYQAGDRLAVIADGMEKNPDLPDFYGEKGIVYAELGRWEEAYPLLKKAIDDFVELQGSNRTGDTSSFGGRIIRAMQLLASCCRELDRADEAEKYLADVQALQPPRERYVPAVEEVFSADEAKELLAQAMPRLFVALLCHEESVVNHNEPSPARHLPESWQNLLRLYFSGEFYPDRQPDSTAYMALLPDVLGFASADVVQKYLLLAGRLPEQERMEVADSLIGCRRYREAMLLLADMAGSVTESGRYSLLAGIACYGMGEYQAAMGCLQQAECRALTGAEQARLISYMAWCREAVAK